MSQEDFENENVASKDPKEGENKKSNIVPFILNFFSAFFIGLLFAAAIVITIYTISITYSAVKQVWISDLCGRIFRDV